MATNICRLCGNLSTNTIDIFRTNGLKHKIETCLPIILYQPCLLPDTICTQCVDNVDAFYSYIKHCIQNILILESQYDIAESCLKSKRKHDRGCSATLSSVFDEQPGVQENISRYKERCEAFQRLLDVSEKLLNLSSQKVQLVEYEDSDADQDYILDLREDIDYNSFGVKRGVKRKIGDILPHRTKIFKFCSNRRRKNTQPKRLADLSKGIGEEVNGIQADDGIILPVNLVSLQQRLGNSNTQFRKIIENSAVIESECKDEEVIDVEVACLLCDAQFTGSDLLAKHVLQTHGIDMARIISSEPVPETQQYQQQSTLAAEVVEGHEAMLNQKTAYLQDIENKNYKTTRYTKTANGRSRKKAVLLKTTSNCGTNSARKQSIDGIPLQQQHQFTNNSLPPFNCPLCSAVLPNRTDLFTHLRLKHPDRAALICGLCFSPDINTFYDLNTHLDQCKIHNQIKQRYYCKVCHYSDDSTKMMEIHIAVHDFLIGYCKEEKKLFDPEEYIEQNINCDTVEKFRCEDCSDINIFHTLTDYIAHKRLAHDIFVCDLCNKSYGRSSHLWKHVHRLHKGHPTVTCPICEKTSASKYHLTQHFFKAHTKTIKNTAIDEKDDDFLNKKFAAFDFQSVRQSFMRQEMMQANSAESDQEVVYDCSLKIVEPFQCSVCTKSFAKRSMLKKHRTNCSPRPQKNLLTRCKSCSRIFKDRQSLAKHLLNYHSEYTCEICSAVVVSKCEIVSHIRFIHPNCKLFCQQCGEILRSQSDMTEHLSDHENSNVCQFCGDLLDSKIKLKMHILSLHRQILSLSCGICLKLFDNQHILRDHVQINHKTELNPLTSCTICGKNYGSKWKAFDHLNKSHGRIFHACKNCLAVFDEPSGLAQHSELGLCGAIDKSPIKSKCQVKSIVNGNNNDVEDSDCDGPGDDIKSSCSEDDSDDLVLKTEPQSDEGNCSEDSDHRVVDIKDEDYLKKKMCLLEKRLLGEKIVAEDWKDGEGVMMKEMHTGEEIVKATPSSPPPQPPQTSFHPISVTAKRTVYVNAQAPACCDICAKTWPAKKHLWQHYIRCHKQDAATVCGICLRTNGGSYTALARHLDETHPDLLYGKGFGSNFICRVCGRYHNARSKLRMHMAIHTEYVADKGKTSNPIRYSRIKEKYKQTDYKEEEDDNEDQTEINTFVASNKTSLSTDNQNHSQHLKNVTKNANNNTYTNKKLVNLDCKTEPIDGSTSSNSSDGCNDTEDYVVTTPNPNPIYSILSTSTDSSADATNANSITDIDSSTTSTSIDDSIPPLNIIDVITNETNVTTVAAQVQLSNAVQSINAQLNTLDDSSVCVEEEIITMDDTDTDMVAMLPTMTLLDTDGHLLSHELQNAVDSIL